MKNYDYWKKSQITDISTFCYWLHQKGVGIYVNIFSPSIVIYYYLGSKWFWEIFSMSDNLFSRWHRLVFCSAVYHYFLSVAGILTILNRTTFLETTKPSHMFNMLLSMKIWLNLILPFVQVIFSPTFPLYLLPKVWQYCEGNA